jgi:L-ascorbate metabolism protein UlaG (beta-lactamase superfamily)
METSRRMPALLLLLLTPVLGCTGQTTFQEDVISTSVGDLTMTFVGHGTLMFRIGDKVIHIDPVGREADYSVMPKADLILVTHEHGDHLDPDVIEELRLERTTVIASESCLEGAEGADVMANGDERDIGDIHIEAVPAYNIVHMRGEDTPYHPRGVGNGYILTFGDTRVYVAGDTENTPEMKALQDIDVAFLPMNLPYTMTPEMVADAAKAFRPGILYPYHFGRTDTGELVTLLEGEDDIEVRIRSF